MSESVADFTFTRCKADGDVGGDADGDAGDDDCLLGL
jgi:hypothetical protein